MLGLAACAVPPACRSFECSQLTALSTSPALQLEVAETVYNDMLALAWRREMEGRAGARLPAPATRRGGLSHRALLPDAEATASLVQGFAAVGELRSAGKYYKQLRRSNAKALAAVTVSHRRMWELLIESNCRQGKVKQALQVFDDWKAAADAWMSAQQQHEAFSDPLTDPAPATTAAADAAAALSDDRANSAVTAAAVAVAAAAAATVAAAGQQASEQQPTDEAQAQAATRQQLLAAARRRQQQQQEQEQPAAAAAATSRLVCPKLSLVALAFLEACCREDPGTEWRVYDVCAQMRRQKEQKRQGSLPRPHKASHHVAPVAAVQP